jgi:hypothetical protein
MYDKTSEARRLHHGSFRCCIERETAPYCVCYGQSLNSGNSAAIQFRILTQLVSKTRTIKICNTIILSVDLCSTEGWIISLNIGRKLQ